MAVPQWFEMNMPLLRLASDGKQHRMRDAADHVAEVLGLTDEDRRETIPSGQARYYNRAGWARAHLAKARLLEQPRRGYFCITDAGRELLKNPPESLTPQYIKDHYPQYVANWKGEDEGDHGGTAVAVVSGEEDQTPDELMETAYQQMRSALASELLDQVKQSSPAFFERLVVQLLVRMGYGGTLRDAGKAVGRSGDGGIDGIIKEDRLGLDAIYIQAKKYTDNAVGRPDLQAFVGALHGARAKKGVFITTSRFAGSALEYAAGIDPKVVLIDGRQLAEYMIDFGVGVTTANTYEVKRIDSDFFDEG